jgi:chemotaxis protein methyltransferase CheR
MRPADALPRSVQAVTAAPDAGREFSFTTEDCDRVRKLIYDHAGISLAPGKRDMVYSRLARRLRAHGLTRFGDYLAFLKTADAAEWEAFTNALTTNLTSFFREAHHFPVLAEHAKRVWQKERRPLTLWCSASSTGEEPYSMAMTMVEAFASSTPPAHILATDVDTSVLAQAEAGVYGMDRVEKLSPERLKRFFLKGAGGNAVSVKVRPELRELVSFRRLNLLDTTWAVRGPFDAIFCRNVMIYFDKPTQLAILEKFAPLMPEGLLFVGHSESLFHAAHLFHSRGRTVYEPARQGMLPAAAAGRSA